MLVITYYWNRLGFLKRCKWKSPCCATRHWLLKCSPLPNLFVDKCAIVNISPLLQAVFRLIFIIILLCILEIEHLQGNALITIWSFINLIWKHISEQPLKSASLTLSNFLTFYNLGQFCIKGMWHFFKHDKEEADSGIFQINL